MHIAGQQDHRFFDFIQRLQHFALVINGPPKVVRLAVNLPDQLLQMPLPVRKSSHPTDPISTNFSGANRGKPMPPKPNRPVAELDPKLFKQILNVPKRQREPDVQHHRQTDDLGARLEVLERERFGHD